MNPTLVTLEDWPLWPERCPCDVDFVDWAESTYLHSSIILHMGTGTHHLVGRKLTIQTNIVLGITCCPAEMESYMSWAVENPHLSGRYRVVFGDLYITDPGLLPTFDIITLFHLCERPDPRRERYGAMTPEETVKHLTPRILKDDGVIVTYSGSATADDAEKALIDAGFMKTDSYRSLRFWKEAAR